MKRSKLVLVAAVATAACLFMPVAVRAEPAKATPAVQALVKKAVEAWLKGRFTVDSVSKTPMPGIVEVRIGTDLLYADEKGSYAIVEGQMVDLKTGENLTAVRVEEISRIDFSKLPLELAMKTVRGNGKRQLVVFEDPYCSFCRTYRKTLLDTKDVTIYTFYFPILRAESVTVSRNAWCAKDRDEAWNDWMLLGKEPAAAPASCKFDSEKLVALGKSLGVTGTPTTFLSDGRRLQGAVNRERLDKALSELK